MLQHIASISPPWMKLTFCKSFITTRTVVVYSCEMQPRFLLLLIYIAPFKTWLQSASQIIQNNKKHIKNKVTQKQVYKNEFLVVIEKKSVRLPDEFQQEDCSRVLVP